MQLVIDVRTVPRSRTNPQYNFDVLGGELQPWLVAYDRIAELGGLRGRAREVPPDVNGFWENQSFHNYADFALSDEFRAGFSSLIELCNERRCAIMCSEAVWWRCHRRFVADYLLHDGWDVFHLMGVARVEVATLNPAARADGASLVYPATNATTS